MATSRRFGTLGFIKQTVAGTPEAAPLFTVPIISGGIRPVKEYDDLPRIGSSMARLGRFTTGQMGQGTVRIMAHPEALGLLLKQVMGSEPTSTGTNPTTHGFAMADTFPYPMTMWSSVGSSGTVGSVFRFTDAYVTRLSIEGQSRGNLEVEMDVSAFTFAARSSIPAVTGTGSSAEDDEPRFKYLTSVVKLNANNTPATVTFTNAERVRFEVDRAPELRYGPSVTPTTIIPERMVNLDVGWVYDTTLGDWDFLLNEQLGTITGATGASPNQSVPRGSFDIKFGRHPADAARYLQLVANGQNWMYSVERPEAEAQPGILEMDAAGICVAPSATYGGTGTTEVTVTLINDFAGAY